eukprot:759541-Hanusia_phi.AAC.6
MNFRTRCMLVRPKTKEVGVEEGDGEEEREGDQGDEGRNLRREEDSEEERGGTWGDAAGRGGFHVAAGRPSWELPSRDEALYGVGDHGRRPGSGTQDETVISTFGKIDVEHNLSGKKTIPKGNWLLDVQTDSVLLDKKARVHHRDTFGVDQAGMDIPARQQGVDFESLSRQPPDCWEASGVAGQSQPASQRVNAEDELVNSEDVVMQTRGADPNISDDVAQRRVSDGDALTGSPGNPAFVHGVEMGEGWWMRGWTTENSNESLPSDHTSGDVSGSDRRTPDATASDNTENADRGFVDPRRARMERRQRLSSRLSARRLNAWSRWQKTLSKVRLTLPVCESRKRLKPAAGYGGGLSSHGDLAVCPSNSAACELRRAKQMSSLQADQ